MKEYLKSVLDEINNSIMSIDENLFEQLVDDCKNALENKNKIVVTGLGKNTAICEKFVGTMLSMGKSACFMHSNTAIHGDIGCVQNGDIVIILTKSGTTAESVYLYEHLKKRNVLIWLLTFCEDGILGKQIEKKIVLKLDHEGDLWNIVPNNSATINLIVLQALAINIAKKTGTTLADFKVNHPGGKIGDILKNV